MLVTITTWCAQSYCWKPKLIRTCRLDLGSQEDLCVFFWFREEDSVDGSEILDQLIGSLSHYFQYFVHPRWCRISSNNSMDLDISDQVSWNSLYIEIVDAGKDLGGLFPSSCETGTFHMNLFPSTGGKIEHIWQNDTSCIGLTIVMLDIWMLPIWLPITLVNCSSSPIQFGLFIHSCSPNIEISTIIYHHPMGEFQATSIRHRIHGTGIFTYIYHRNQPFM